MSWSKVRLGDVCEINYGTRVRRKDSSGGEFPVYGGGGETFRWPTYNRENQCIVSRFAMSEECVRFVKGKFFLNDSGLSVVTKDGALSQKFLDWCLYGRQPMIYAMGRGSAQRNLEIDKFEDIQLPLPPLAEQKKIVEKVEKALERVDALKAQFERMEKSAADYFKAALAETFAAVKGEKVKLGEVSEIAYGYTAKSRCDDGNGDPKYLRITDIQDDSVDWSRVPVCQCDDIRSYLLAQGDIVFARTGATTGKSFLLEGDFPKSVYASYLIRVKLRNKRIVPQYLRWYFDTESYWSVIRCGMAGAAQGGFNSKKLAALEIPVPSVEEQIRIDQIMRQAKVKKENLIYFARRCIGICDKMRKAILAEAFQ